MELCSYYCVYHFPRVLYSELVWNENTTKVCMRHLKISKPFKSKAHLIHSKCLLCHTPEGDGLCRKHCVEIKQVLLVLFTRFGQTVYEPIEVILSYLNNISLSIPNVVEIKELYDILDDFACPFHYI